MAETAQTKNSKLITQKTRADRKDAVATATWRVVAANGLEGATLRAIASEAGCTTGVLMHHFRDKEDLFIFALDRMFEHAEVELVEALRQENPLSALRNFLFDYLALSPNSKMQARSWLNFVGRALWNKPFLREYRARYARFRALIEKVLQAAADAGIISYESDLDVEADILFALLDGTTIHALLEPARFPPKRQRALIDRCLGRLVNPIPQNRAHLLAGGTPAKLKNGRAHRP